MLGVTVPDIHRSLDKAVQATMIPAARVRGIYIDAARLEQYEQALVTAAIGGDEKAIATAVRVQERKATLSRFDTLPGRARTALRTPQRLLRRDRAARRRSDRPGNGRPYPRG